MADGTGPAADPDESPGSAGTGSDTDAGADGPASGSRNSTPETDSDRTTPAPSDASESPSDSGVAEAASDTDDAGVEAYTTERRTLSPRVQALWALRVVLGGLVVAFLARAVAGRVGFDPRVGPALGVGLTLLGLVWVAMRYRVWAYELRADALFLQRGVVTHRRTLAPFVRIQHVDTSRGPLERGLGLSTLVVYTAGSRGADVSIPGLTPTEAADLQRRVKELAIEAEGGDAV